MPAPHLNQEERGPGPAPEPKPAGDLWPWIIAPPFFAVVGIGLPLTSTPVDGDEWGKVGVILGSIAFLGIWATAVSRPLLKELARRGEWVPPGTARYPGLVALAIPVPLPFSRGARSPPARVAAEVGVRRRTGGFS